MNPDKQLVKVLKKMLARTTPQNYRSFRSTNLKYVTNPLSALGSALAGGRFNPKGFEALYTSLEIETMIAEMQHYANTDPRLAGRFRPSSILTLEATGLKVLDLSNSEIQSALGTNTQELSGNFIRIQNRGLESPTQTLGRVNIEHLLFDAVIAESARQDNGKNLVIFTDVADFHACTVMVFDPETYCQQFKFYPKQNCKSRASNHIMNSSAPSVQHPARKPAPDRNQLAHDRKRHLVGAFRANVQTDGVSGALELRGRGRKTFLRQA